MPTGLGDEAPPRAPRGSEPLDAYRTPDRLKARIAMHERFGNQAFDLHERIFELLLGPAAPFEGRGERRGERRGEGLGEDPGEGLQEARVLEVGAGTGRMWRTVRARLPAGWNLTLTDRSEGMLAALRSLTAELDLNASVSHADAMELPFPDATFDLVFANHMLYHVPEPATAIREFRRVLRPGGVLVAATNGEGHMRQATELIRPLAELGGGPELMGVSPLSFTSESGAVLLKTAFADVQLHRFDDSLQVTDHQVLLAYLRSLVHLPDQVSAELSGALAAWERTVLAVPLPFLVGRATGVFLARA